MEEPRLDTSVPFTRAHAVALGIDAKTIRGPRFREVFRDVLVSRDVELTTAVRARAALTLHLPTAFVSHVTAADIMGLPVPSSDRVHITAATQEERRQHPGIACHIACSETDVVDHAGLRISSPLDLFIELAGVLSVVDLVVAGDAMVKLGLFTADELRAFCAGTRRWHSRRARRGAVLVRDGVDSPMETRVRLLLVWAGLPEPVVNLRVTDSAGNERRLDLAYPFLKIAIEYDGRHHIEREAQWNQDLRRRENLEADGWRFVVITSKGVYKEPEDTIARVVQALAQRGQRSRSVRDTWKVHFRAA